jgi:electron transfer flavoprotein alpha subunit
LPGTQRVLVLAEVAESGGPSRLTVELMGLGGRLAEQLSGKLGAVLPGYGGTSCAGELLSLGARVVYLADHPTLAQYDPDLYLEVLRGLPRDSERLTVLAGQTAIGQDLMPRLAFELEAGLVTDCVGVEVGATGQDPVFVKPVFGGNALASFSVRTTIRLATVRARVGTAPEPGETGGEVITLKAPSGNPGAKVLAREKEDRGIRLEDSRVVVAGGRGMGGVEGFDALGELAVLLGGAVGASRPPCDSGWVSSTAQVGITGKIVAPDLYIAVGISGSSQHLSGMGEAEKVVAINQDPEAYIFKVADYGVAGDWRQALPAFTERLRKYTE